VKNSTRYHAFFLDGEAMRNIITVLRSDSGGASAVEDGIALGIAGIVIFSAWPYLGGSVLGLFHAVGQLFGSR